MKTEFFDPDVELKYYVTDTPNNLQTGMKQLDLQPKKYATNRKGPYKQKNTDNSKRRSYDQK